MSRSREQKNPDTSTFHYHNQNPKNRITSDCVVRAISLATGIEYNQVVMDLAKLQCESGYDDAEPKLYDKYLQSKGWVKQNQPRKYDNTKYTGEEFCRYLQFYYRKENGSVIAHIGGHHIVAIVPVCDGDGENDRFKVCDIWNSTYKCIGNYWVKADSGIDNSHTGY